MKGTRRKPDMEDILGVLAEVVDQKIEHETDGDAMAFPVDSIGNVINLPYDSMRICRWLRTEEGRSYMEGAGLGYSFNLIKIDECPPFPGPVVFPAIQFRQFAIA